MASERLAGLRTRIEKAGGTCPADAVALFGPCGGHEQAFVDLLLAGETRPDLVRRRFTAIVCYNDWIAVYAIKHLKERGLRVPEDISVTGFDDVQPAWYDGPKLTTCAVPLEEVGAESARFLYWCLEHPNAIRRTLVVETELVEGKTVRKESV